MKSALRLLLPLGFATVCGAETGSEPPPGQPIPFGQSAAFSGPAQELGRDMRIGIEAAFEEANRRGGVHGRPLELQSLDDRYEPELAIENTRSLIQSGVFALIGAVGTPTSRAAVPVAASAGVPYVAPFTGAAFLRDTRGQGEHVLNLRASYDDETEAMVARLLGDLGIERIAVMYQDDSFGRAGHHGVQQALQRRGMAPVAVGVYPRNTTALISWARHIGFDPVFITISFVGSNALARQLGGDGTGVFVTQVVPFPDGDHPVVLAYQQALREFAPEAAAGFVSLEGYLAGRLAIAALERCQGLDRECFLGSLRSEDRVDIDGFPLRYGEHDNQGSDDVFLTVIDAAGRYRPITTLEGALR